MAAKYSGTSPIDAIPGLTQNFGCRPEPVFDSVAEVIDASIVRKRKVDGLHLFRIQDVFTSANEVFVGIGLPNAYLAVPDGKGSYEKLSVKSLKRAPTTIDDTHDLVQAGVQIWLEDCPAEARDNLRAVMPKYVGSEFATCMLGVGTVMTEAGFTTGGKPLTTDKLPADFLRHLVRDGLEFKGESVKFRFLRTSNTPATERFALQVKKAELMTIQRHMRKNLEKKARVSKPAAAALWVFNVPGRIKTAIFGSGELPREFSPVAKGLPYGGQYEEAMLSVSMPGTLGTMLRLFWGSHALFEVRPHGTNIETYLPETLEAFPVVKDTLTRAKKYVLFAKLPVSCIRWLLCPTFVPVGMRDERSMLNAMRTHTEEQPNKYNLAVVGSQEDFSITLSRVKVGWKWINKIIDWILAKHVLMTGWSKFVRFCGEKWKDIDGVLWISPNSGTYQPTVEQVKGMVRLLRKIMPHTTVKAVDIQGNEIVVEDELVLA